MQHFATYFRIVLGTTICVVGVLKTLAGEHTNLLANPGIEFGKNEQPSVWFAAHVSAEGLTMVRDTDNAYSGTYSLAIHNSHHYEQQVSNNWMQRLRIVPRSKAIQVRGFIRTENADAANICLQCWDLSGNEMLAFSSTPVFRGDQGWTEATSRILLVPENTAEVIVRAALTGVGKVWFDELIVSVVEYADTVSHSGSAELYGPDKTTDGAALADLADREVNTAEASRTDSQLPDQLLQLAPGRVVGSAAIVKDCMILSYLPNWNHGTVDNLAVANNGGGVRTLFDWNKRQLKYPTDENHRYYLALYSRETTAKSKPGEVMLYGINEEWKERTSWRTQPEIADEPTSVEEFKVGIGWKLFDVTELVRSPTNVHGVMLRFNTEDKAPQTWSGYAFSSREGIGQWQKKRPLLLIVDTAVRE